MVARTRTRNIDDQPDEMTEQQDAVVVSDSRRRRRAGAQDESGAVVAQPAGKDRPTPSARQVKARGIGSTGLINRIPVVRSVVAYFRGVKTELDKVTWPTREETVRLTRVVLGVTVAFALALGALNLAMGWWFQQAFHKDSETTFLVIAAVVAAGIGAGYAVLRNRI